MAWIAGFLAASQTPEGAFRDRAGQADLYYTAFGLGAAVALNEPGAANAATVRACGDGFRGAEDFDFIDLVSLLRCRRYLPETAGPPTRDVIDTLRAYRSLDGGYSHEHRRADTGTMYGAFLSEQAFRDAGVPWDAVAFVRGGLARLAAPDGGYANHPGALHGVATATASALVLRARYGGDCPAAHLRVWAFLDRLRHPGGGVRAAQGAPGPDLLSTASVLYAQVVSNRPAAPEALTADGLFVETLWSDAGGFRGQAADPVPDVEYTFYALLALGAVAMLRTRKIGTIIR